MIRKTLALLLFWGGFVWGFAPLKAQLQKASENANPSTKLLIKVNPLSFFVLTANVQAEVVLNDKSSAQFGFFIGGITSSASTTNQSLEVGYNWLGITGEYRYYAQTTSKEVPQGLYLAPFIRFRRDSQRYISSLYDPDLQDYSVGSVTKTTNLIGGGVSLGFQWIFGEVFALDCFFGPQYLAGPNQFEFDCETCNGNEAAVEEQVGINFRGVGIRLGLALGLAI